MENAEPILIASTVSDDNTDISRGFDVCGTGINNIRDQDASGFDICGTGIDINSIKNEEHYIINNLIERLCIGTDITMSDKNDDIETISGKHFSFIKRRLDKYIYIFSNTLNKRSTSGLHRVHNTDQLDSLNHFIYKIKNIFLDCGRTQLMSRSLTISSYMYVNPETMERCINSVKLSNIKDPRNEKNSQITSYWIHFKVTPMIYFLGTRFDNTADRTSDKFQLYSGDGSPVVYFFQTLAKKIESIVNSDQFKNDNREVVVTKGSTTSMTEFYESTKHIDINFDIRGTKDPIIFKFDTDDAGKITLNLMKKKIEETELISMISSFQLKLYLVNENLNGTIMAWSRVSIAV